jgi:hypothetical protein
VSCNDFRRRIPLGAVLQLMIAAACVVSSACFVRATSDRGGSAGIHLRDRESLAQQRGPQRPESISASAFRAMISQMSEAGAGFISDNVVSNEAFIQRIVPEISRRAPAMVLISASVRNRTSHLSQRCARGSRSSWISVAITCCSN